MTDIELRDVFMMRGEILEEVYDGGGFTSGVTIDIIKQWYTQKTDGS